MKSRFKMSLVAGAVLVLGPYQAEAGLFDFVGKIASSAVHVAEGAVGGATHVASDVFKAAKGAASLIVNQAPKIVKTLAPEIGNVLKTVAKGTLDTGKFLESNTKILEKIAEEAMKLGAGPACAALGAAVSQAIAAGTEGAGEAVAPETEMAASKICNAIASKAVQAVDDHISSSKQGAQKQGVTKSLRAKTPSSQDLLKANYNKAAQCPGVSPENVAKGKKLFEKLLTGKLETADIAQWEALDFKASTQGPYVIVQEKEDKRQGRGLFMFRTGAKPFFLQAPHYPHDFYTGDIALSMFHENQFLVGAWNTAPRECVDLSHATGTYFNALTQAFAERFPSASLLQLHAFDGPSRDLKTALIMSSTLKNPPQAFINKANCLKKGLTPPFTASLYPTEISILGGTTNENAKVFKAASSGTFFHLEMNMDFRKNLLNNKQMRDHIVGCAQ